MPSDLPRPNRCCVTFNASWFPWLDLCRVNREVEHQLIGSPLEVLDTVPARLTLEIWETRRSGAAVRQRISRLRTTILQPTPPADCVADAKAEGTAFPGSCWNQEDGLFWAAASRGPAIVEDRR
jgi:hypothetical protein